MFARKLLAAVLLVQLTAACADPEAAAEIEIRKTNAIATIRAVQETYCTLSEATRARLRAAGDIPDDQDTCNSATEDTK